MKKGLIKKVGNFPLACWLKNAKEHPHCVKKIIVWQDFRDGKYLPQNILDVKKIENMVIKKDPYYKFIGIINVEKETLSYQDIVDLEVKKFYESQKLVQT